MQNCHMPAGLIANVRLVVAVLFKCLWFTAKVTCGNFLYRFEFSKLSWVSWSNTFCESMFLLYRVSDHVYRLSLQDCLRTACLTVYFRHECMPNCATYFIIYERELDYAMSTVCKAADLCNVCCVTRVFCHSRFVSRAVCSSVLYYCAYVHWSCSPSAAQLLYSLT